MERSAPSFTTPGPAAGRQEPGEVLVHGDAIRERVQHLAAAISAAHAGQELTVICVLDGAVIFTADLLRQLTVPTRLETVRASSYRGSRQTPGTLTVSMGNLDLAGRHALLVDDILDSGRTLLHIREHLAQLRPASLEICVLLDKPARRQVELRADWIGLTVPDRFVVGYGLDFDGWYRDLPHIYALERVEQTP